MTEIEFSPSVARALDGYAPAPEGAGDWQDALRRAGVSRAREWRWSRARLALAAAVVIALAAAPAYAIGRTVVDWLAAEPAPPEIVSDFGKYTPQLGFNPEPGKAVLVAEDDYVRLFATTNKQGTYCFIVSTRADGGTCVRPTVAAASVVAGYVSDVAAGKGDMRLRVVVGRIKNPEARGVSFAAPDGKTITRRIGAGGFFVAGLRTATVSACEDGGWAPPFTFYNADGHVVAERTITLAFRSGTGTSRGCVAGFLSSADG
jgi:hypothetical protein